MAKGGRVVLNKDGKEVARHHIDPHSKADTSPTAVSQAHGYAQHNKALAAAAAKNPTITAPLNPAQETQVTPPAPNTTSDPKGGK
jgi:hypothetical protein